MLPVKNGFFLLRIWGLTTDFFLIKYLFPCFSFPLEDQNPKRYFIGKAFSFQLLEMQDVLAWNQNHECLSKEHFKTSKLFTAL